LWRRSEVLEAFGGGNLKERDYFEKLGIVGRIKLRIYEMKT
jgi:hypothetical protein